MRRNATKVAAAVLSLAVTMTSVNIPVSAAAATKKVKLNKTEKTLKVGKTFQLKVKEGSKNVTSKATFTSNNTKIAKVNKKGKVTAKKKGSTKIVATYKNKKYKCKVTVKKATTAATTAPTTVPTTAPTQTPVEPTQAPPAESTAPTQGPSDVATVGAIASFKATKADTFTAEFTAAMPAGTTCEVTKNGVKQEGEWQWSDDRKTATFKGKAEFLEGEYTVTVNTGSGEALTAKASVTDRVATDIKLLTSTKTGQRALTNPEKESVVDGDGHVRKANTQAYIYYEVVDQYGEKMNDSTDITWSITSSVSYTTDTSAGRITIQKSKDGDGQAAYIYGEKIHVKGVYINGNKTITVDDEVEIGETQATDNIKVAGFINANLKDKKIETNLPKKFAKDTWYMVYTTYDQNGHEMVPIIYDDDDITIVPDSASSFKITIPTENVGDKLYTVGGTKYASVKVQPSTQTDRGGDVTLTAISKKTGHTTPYSFKIAEAGILKSIQIIGPEKGVIADGDAGKVLSYKALDINGKETKDYETIVRSSNVLSLTASEGIVKVSEDEKGEAVITWTDDDWKKKSRNFEAASAKDKADRRVALTFVVSGQGGETLTSIINVKDTRRPVAFSNIKWGEDGNGAVVIKGYSEDIDFTGDKVTYVDQYGEVLKGSDPRTIAFFDRAMKEGFNKEIYAIRVETDNNTELEINNSGHNNKGEKNWDNKSEYQLFNWKGGITGAVKDDVNVRIKPDDSVIFEANDRYSSDSSDYDTKSLDANKLVDKVQVTYSIVSVKETEVTDNKLQSGKDFTKVGEAFTDEYSVVPTSAIRDNVSIELNNTTGKYFLKTANSLEANGTHIDFVEPDGTAKLNENVYLNDKGGDESLLFGGSQVTVGELTGTSDKNNIIENDKLGFTVKGTTKSGLTCTLPKYFYQIDDSSVIQIDNVNKNKITAISSSAIRWNELYDDNNARNTRIDANKTLAIQVMTTKVANENKEDDWEKYVHNVVTKNIKISDAIPVPSSLDSAYNPNPAMNWTGLRYVAPGANQVFDQYGEVIEPEYLVNTYSVANWVENENEDLAHLLNSFTPFGNGTGALGVDGVEIGDTFDFTISVGYEFNPNAGFTTQPYKLTAPADTAACILSNNIYKTNETGDYVDENDNVVTKDNDRVIETKMNSDKEWREAEIIANGLGMKY